MSNYVAKKASLNVVRECQGNACYRFTDKGYYIHYKNGNVDSMLFVCEDCYNAYYKSKCTIGSFDEEKYQRSVHQQRYYTGNPTSQKFFRGCRKGIRFARIVCIILSVLFTSVFCFIEQPKIRTEYILSEPKIRINSNIRGFNGVSLQIKKIINHITTVNNHDGGKK